MQLPAILTLIATSVALCASAQTRGDDLILDMNQAYKRGDTRRLTQLLPQARAHYQMLAAGKPSLMRIEKF